MFCPVCKTEIEETSRVCPTCGFKKLHVEFISSADAINWMNRVVVPYRTEWEKRVTDANDVYIEMLKQQTAQLNRSKEQGKSFEFTFDDRGAVVTKFFGSYPIVFIPDFIEGKPVYKIGKEAFKKCIDLHEIELPNNLKIIDVAAFEGCALRSIEFPESLEVIENFAFRDTALGEVCIPEKVRYIGKEAFKVADKHVDSLSGVFGFSDGKNYSDGKTKISKITRLGSNVEFIGPEAFSGTDTEKLIFPKALKTISIGTCSNCKKLETVVILGAKVIETNAFEGCTILKNVIFPEGLNQIRSRAFSGCAIDKLIFPSTLASVASNSLLGNNGFGVTRLAFQNDKTYIEPIKEDVWNNVCQTVIVSFDRNSVIFYCNSGSSPEKYAREHLIHTKSLSDFS